MYFISLDIINGNNCVQNVIMVLFYTNHNFLQPLFCKKAFKTSSDVWVLLREKRDKLQCIWFCIFDILFHIVNKLHQEQTLRLRA